MKRPHDNMSSRSKALPFCSATASSVLGGTPPLPPRLQHIQTWSKIASVPVKRMNEIGVDPFIVERILNHAIGGIAAVYNLASYTGQKREALEAWADRVAEITG